MLKPQVIESQQNLICMNKHDLPISQVVWDPKLKYDQRLLCTQCVEDYESETRTMGYKKVFQIIEEKQRMKIQEYENLLMPHINSVLQFQTAINTLKQNIIQQLDQLQRISEDWIKNLESTKQEISKYSFFQELDKLIKNEQNNFDENKYKKEIQLIHTEWSNQLTEKLDLFKNFQQYNDCQEILKKINQVEESLQLSPPLSPIKLLSERFSIKLPTQSKSSNQLSNLLGNSQIANSPFTYQLLPQMSHKQTYFCRAIAINHDNSLIIVACNSNIKIMEILLDSQLQLSSSTINSINEIETKKTPKLLQLLQGEHQDFVNTLNFFRNTPSMLNSFLSGSKDSTIIIWSPINFSSQLQPILWGPLFKLNGHSNSIRCLIIHPLSEDLVISGSDDSSIKFWSCATFFQQKCQWTCQQTINEHLDCVWGLSLNEDGNKLISCGEDKQILVMELSNKQQWEVKQKIQVEIQGMRICFINNNQFSFQACSGKALPNLHIYTLNPSSGLFSKSKDILVYGGGQPCVFYFPQQYIPSKQLLISKNGCYVNLIRFQFSSFDEIQESQLEQSIHFGIECDGEIFGTMSEDGEFLITWDSKSKDVQIRQYIERKQ
ncbi:unnamed protein product [Paramecium primaurelia]|uniref:Uncharacterized protein n=1 Tax=Paramecium primaurelia TaxID=5886 RepID=A0A8S1Q3A0_PARPR|nr:unnamed protein product [Paramecium primaurelia]